MSNATNEVVGEGDCWVWAGEVYRLDGSTAEWSFDDHAPEDSLMVLEG